MDSFGQIFLVVAILAFLTAAAVFWLLSRHGPRGATLGLAFLLYLASCYIDDGGSRALHGAIGVMRLIGFMGIILGVVDLVRKPRHDEPGN